MATQLAYLSASRIPSSSANSIHVMKMCQAFARCGAEVTLFARDEGPAVGLESFYGVEGNFSIERRVWPKIRHVGGLVYGWKVSRALKKSSSPHWLYGRDLYSLLFAVRMQIPFMYEAHAFPRNPVKLWLEKQLFRRPHFAGLTVISDALANQYQITFPFLAPDKITVFRDGADEPDPDPLLVSSLKEKLGDRVLVGYVGTLFPGKGMEVISRLSADLPECDFHVVGGDEAEIQTWKATIAGKNVVFHGRIDHAQVPEYLHVFDILLAPYQESVSVYGGGGDVAKWMSPLKLFEYMASGRPVVCSDLPVLREILKHRKTALFCSPHEIGEWVHAIRELIASPQLGDALGQNARIEFRENYTWKSRAQGLLELMRLRGISGK